MAALAAASRRLLHLRPELELCLRSRALIPYPSRATGAGRRLRHEPSCRRLVIFRQGAHGEESAARSKAMASPDGEFTPGKDDRFAKEFAELSMEEEKEEEEEESDDAMCGIGESMMQDVQKAAVGLLAARAYTVTELTKKLRAKNYPVDTVNSVIADFKSRGLLNDGYYAESFSRSRWLSSTWGPKRIKQALRQKGVPDAEVDQATCKVFQDGHGHSDQTMHGISEASMDHLFVQASKQWQRGQRLPLETRRARIVRWLQYRGFNWAITTAIVKKLEAQHPPP